MDDRTRAEYFEEMRWTVLFWEQRYQNYDFTALIEEMKDEIDTIWMKMDADNWRYRSWQQRLYDKYRSGRYEDINHFLEEFAEHGVRDSRDIRYDKSLVKLMLLNTRIHTLLTLQHG